MAQQNDGQVYERVFAIRHDFQSQTKAHFGFIGIGIFAFTTQAGTGAVLYMVNHGLATGLLFLVVGMLVARRGSALVSDFGGAGKLVPLLAGVFLIAALASLSLPGMSPFVSEFLVLQELVCNRPRFVDRTALDRDGVG